MATYIPQGTDGAAVPTTAVPVGGTDGTLLQTLKTDSDGNLQVDVLTMPTTTVSGTVGATQSTSPWVTTAVGTVADDGTTPGSPVMIGGKAVETDGTDPTSVSAEDDVAICRTDRNRRLLVNDRHPNAWYVTPAAYTVAKTNEQVKAAPGAGSLYITDILVSNGATAGIITLLDGSGGTVIFRAYCAVNGGAVWALRTPIRLTPTTGLYLTSTTVTTHSVSISGYTAP